jgi:hypothetical protein
MIFNNNISLKSNGPKIFDERTQNLNPLFHLQHYMGNKIYGLYVFFL